MFEQQNLPLLDTWSVTETSLSQNEMVNTKKVDCDDFGPSG